MPVLLLFGKLRQAGRQAFKTSLRSRVRLYLKSRHDYGGGSVGKREFRAYYIA